MTWTKLGDEWPDSARDLSDAAYRTHVDALCWSNRRGLDLVVPKRELRRFAETDDPDTAVAELVAAGWWEDRGDRWWIGVQFADWQQEAAVVKQKRDASALTSRRNRLHKVGDHTLCLPGRCSPPLPGDASRQVSSDSSRELSPGTGRDGAGLGGHGEAVEAVLEVAPPPPDARADAVTALWLVVEKGLPPDLRQSLTRTGRIDDALGRHHDTGWSPSDLAAAVLGKDWTGVRSGGAVDRWLTGLPAAPAPSSPPAATPLAPKRHCAIHQLDYARVCTGCEADRKGRQDQAS